MTHLRNVLKQSHIGCQQYANNMTHFSETNFLEQFKDQRIQILNNFVHALTKANRGYLFNCFDIQNLALPLECSLQNNYWCAQAIQMSLNHAEKEIKFL